MAVWSIVGMLALVAGLVPVVVWNARHDWPTLWHLLGQAHLPGGDTLRAPGWRYSPLWTLEFLVVQVLVVGPALWIAIIAMARSRRAWKEDEPRRARDLFILCCSVPPILFALVLSLVTKVQANWTFAGYVPLMAFAGGAIVRGMDEWKRDVAGWRARPKANRPREGFFRRQPETLVQVLWNATVVLGVALALGLLRLDVVAGGVARLKATPIVSWLIPSGVGIPLGRFTGADQMGKHATELLARLQERRPRGPFVLTEHYGRAAHLEFYMEGHPLVYCASAYVPGGRRSQYDLWNATSLHDAKHLLGRDALIVGGHQPKDWLLFFERVELLGRLDGDGKPDRPAFYGYGYRGVDAAVAEASASGKSLVEAMPSPPLPTYPTAPHSIPFPKTFTPANP